MRLLITILFYILVATVPSNAAEKSFAIVGSEGNSIGGINFNSGPHGSVITISISRNGLAPGWHGIHIHQVGDCSDLGTFTMSKGHVNPGNSKHGFLNPDGPHSADLPNIFATSDGSVNVELFVPNVILGNGKGENLLDSDGSAIIIHANPDDHMSQPIGGAGPRVACAVIN